ncbi:hypothetical protein [Humidisolicoccus flavus]|uniref:hypothetical protein n=1 Tax=Humidisolicoccus flavus TaxID=3111414 RepID=UPI003252C152
MSFSSDANLDGAAGASDVPETDLSDLDLPNLDEAPTDDEEQWQEDVVNEAVATETDAALDLDHERTAEPEEIVPERLDAEASNPENT